MQQTEYTKKFVQLWNDTGIDTHHDIIVSVDYALFNYDNTPSCGFCIALFESISDKPRGGGENYSLAYTPNIGDDSNISKGLEYAIYGVGFDVNGIFAKRTPYVEGVDHTTSNSICVRDGIKNDYRFLKQSENILYSYNFEIAQQKTSVEEDNKFKQVKLVFSKCMSKLHVEFKNNDDKDFTNVFECDLPIMDKKSVKVGLFYTSNDQNSKFLLKQFNVAGFPLRPSPDYDLPCFQEINCNYDIIGNKLPSNENWVIAPYLSGFDVFKFDGKEFYEKTQLRNANGLKILNYSENLIYAKSNNKLLIYEFRGNDICEHYILSLPTNDDITSCAGYGDSLVISTSSSGEKYYIYKYVRESNNLAELGTWKYYQTFNYASQTGFGTNVEMSENYILSYSTNDVVVSFKNNNNYGYQYHQTILPPYSDAKGFGYSMSIGDDSEIIIGAPFGSKRYIQGENEGEVFHYVLSQNTKKWELISEIGQNFNLYTLSGSFGYSVKLKNNRAVVGCPFEIYTVNGNQVVEVPKQGKVYVFERDEFGYFTKRVVYYPPTVVGDVPRNYGKQVNIFGDELAIGMPFSSNYSKHVIDVYNLKCTPLAEPMPLNGIVSFISTQRFKRFVNNEPMYTLT